MLEVFLFDERRTFSVGCGPNGSLLDSANTISIDGSDVNVALISPRSTPGVSHDVVLLSTAGSIADGGDGVIEVGSASSGVEDARLVALEDRFVGLYCN